MEKLYQVVINGMTYDILSEKDEEFIRKIETYVNGKVTATVFVEPIVSKEIDVPVKNISFINMPENLEVEWPADVENYNLTISGLWEYINSVQQENVTGYVDVAAYLDNKNVEELKPGEHIVPVTFNFTEDVSTDEELNVSVIFVVPEEGE